MSYLELADLTEDERLLKQEVHKFAEEIVRPASIEIDQMPSDKYQKKVTKDNSPYWEVMRKMKKLGYHRAAIPEKFGGEGLSGKEMHILIEELAWGSSGFAMALGVDLIPVSWGIFSSNDYLMENLVKQWLEDRDAKYQGCLGSTEPEHGSDIVLSSSIPPEDREKIGTGQVTAKKDGDEWVINGQKSNWISAGPVATHVGLRVNLDFTKGEAWDGCIVPLDQEGVTRGKPIIKLGQRECPQGELIFDDVRISDKHMIPFKEMLIDTPLNEHFRSVMGSWMAACSTGLARAAFEEALQYSKERIQGGKPLCEHQIIKKKLFEMFMKVETARSYSRRVFQHVWDRLTTFDASYRHALAAHVYCKQIAYEVADEAVQIHGGYGVTEDFLVEKLYRDARVKLIEDCTTEALSLSGADNLVKDS